MTADTPPNTATTPGTTPPTTPGTESTTEAMATAQGLKPEEFQRAQDILGRVPNVIELGIFASMWSEHCSYKSSKVWLQTLPTSAPHVVHGPGENAGVIDIGDGDVCVFKVESHNHPSFLEPFQGAATGVGGIMRDVFTMGARPIANLNALRFGAPQNPRTRGFVEGVTSGIGAYGNCFGVPTVGGECAFDAGYDRNILVNAMTVGLARRDGIFLSAASGVGNLVVYVGARTGRDGIHGATMASAAFSHEQTDKRPTVQVGDPFKEKILMEACLELMAAKAIVAIQDMGAAGLTSSSVEMADKGGVGMALHLDQVPVADPSMQPCEMMLSESQERMLMILAPDAQEQARAIFQRWELDIAIIGTIIQEPELRLLWHQEQVATIPVAPLVAQSPLYRRPQTPSTRTPAGSADVTPHQPVLSQLETTLCTMLASPHLCARSWIWQGYDHIIGGQVLTGPGGDAAVVGLPGQAKALAITLDSTPRYSLADPREGAKQAVAEAYRNVITAGATPLAITNNLNFGSPEDPVVMDQFVQSIHGMKEACLTLKTPVVSGNVSFYNETDSRPIPPTPVIGCVGLLQDRANIITVPLKTPGDAIFLLGAPPTHLGCSRYGQILEGRTEGPPPQVDIELEARHGAFILQANPLISACHDVSDGGLIIALCEMIFAAFKSNLGGRITHEAQNTGFWFGEDQGRYVLTTSDPEALTARAQHCGVQLIFLGTVTDDACLTFPAFSPISTRVLFDAHAAWFPNYMAGADQA